MVELRKTLIALFSEAGKAHHHAFQDVDGADPEWPAWYASHLLNQLGPALGTWLSHQDLAEELANLAEQHRKEGPHTRWQEFYADHFIQKYHNHKENQNG